jgi:PhnB protein
MAMSWKPEGYASVSPYLVADGAQAVIDFLKHTFGATELQRFDKPDGSIMHAEVLLDDAVVMIGEAGEHWPSVRAHVHVYVDDVDRAYRRALDAGGGSVQPPQQREGEADRRAGVSDPAGNTWWIGTRIG